MLEENWKDWYKGTEQWYRYRAASASARRKMAIPPMRDPSQFPIKSFFEVDDRTGRNRYGLKPTVVTAKRSSKQKQSEYLNDPIKFMWKFGILKAADRASINEWKRYIYSYLTLTFSWLVKRPDGYAIPRDGMKTFFCGGGPFDFTKELANEVPDQATVEKLWNAVGYPKASLRIPWDQVYGGKGASKQMRGKKLPYTHENLKRYLERKYPQAATRLSPMPQGRPPRGGSQLLKAYTIMVILGECRARVLSREVGKYDTGYVKFSNRRRDKSVKRVAQTERRHKVNQKEILARGKGLVSLADFPPVWQQEGQTLDDLDAESLEYFNAWEAGDLVDPYRNEGGRFDRFSKENAPPPPQVIPPDVPKSLSKSPSPALNPGRFAHMLADTLPLGPDHPQSQPLAPRRAPRKRIVRPSPSPSVEVTGVGRADSPIREIDPPETFEDLTAPAAIVSNDPAPENRPNPRASTEPPVFNTSIKPELESPSPAPHFDTARGASLGHSLTPPPGQPIHLAEHDLRSPEIPEPQIEAHCPLPVKGEHVKGEHVKGEHEEPSESVEIIGERVDLTKKRVTWADDIPVEEAIAHQAEKNSNTLYLLAGLALVGVAVWLGEDNRSGVMPYY